MSRRAWQVVAVAVAAVVGANIVLERISDATRTPGGPVSSSFATAPGGLAAYAELLRRSGHPVRRLRDPPAEAGLDPAATLIVLDPEGLTSEDERALRSFVEAGGRLVGGGPAPHWLVRAWGGRLEWSEDGSARMVPLAPAAEIAAVREVRAAGGGAWSETGSALPLLGGARGALLAVAKLGSGRLVLLADASPLQNRLLGTGDNAALGVALVGARGRPVHFAESVHGFGRGSGVAALPDRWLWTLGGLVAAALVWMLARGRRLGPPEGEERELPPPRQLYVESLAALLAKTRRPAEAAAPVQEAVRARLARATGLGSEAREDDLRRAGSRLGLGDDELRAALGPVRSRDELLALGRALARLERGAVA